MQSLKKSSIYCSLKLSFSLRLKTFIIYSLLIVEAYSLNETELDPGGAVNIKSLKIATPLLT